VVIPPDPNAMLAINNDFLVSTMMSWFDRYGVSEVVLALLDVNRKFDNQNQNICALKPKETQFINRQREINKERRTTLNLPPSELCFSPAEALAFLAPFLAAADLDFLNAAPGKGTVGCFW